MRRTTNLEATVESLMSWRREHGGRGRRIPEVFWNEARKLALVHGVEQTARALQLDRGRLAVVAGQVVTAAPQNAEPEGFIELTGLKGGAHGGVVVVEFLGAGGDCVRVQVAPTNVDLVALAAAFWGKRP